MNGRWGRRALVLVLVLTLVRLVVIASTGLSDTEAYYVGWARWLDFSYYDHPPLVAWTTWLVTRVATGAFAVRVVPVLSSAAFGLLAYRFAARLFSPRAGFLALLFVSVMPAFLVTSILVNPEALLAPLWMLALDAIYDLRDRDEPWRPLALGAIIGVGFLAKYTMILAVPLALAWIVFEARRWLRRPSLYAGGLVALAITSPVIVWNAQRGFPSVHLHLVERVARPSLATYASNALHTALSQLGLFHPLLVPALLTAAVVMLMRRRDVRFRFLAWMGLPTLAFFLVMMTRVRDAEPHWTMVAWVPLAIGLAALMDEAFARPLARGYVITAAASGALALGLYLVHMASPVFLRFVPASLYSADADPVNETLGWDRIDRAITAQVERLGPDAVVASNHNVLCGHLEVSLGDSPHVYCASERRTEFDFVGRGQVPHAAPVVYVETERYARDPAGALPGRKCSLADRVDITRAGRVIQSARIWSCGSERESGAPQAMR